MLRVITCSLFLVLAAGNLMGQSAEDYFKAARSHFDAGQYQVALADTNKAIELNPKLVNAYVLRFHITKKLDPESDALGDTNKIIELAPDAPTSWPYYLNRSNFLLRQPNSVAAIRDLNKAIALTKSERGFIYNVRAFAHLMNEDTAKAHADYFKSLEFKASFPSPFVRRAYFRAWKMDFAGASSDYTKAIEWKSNYAEAYAYRGIMEGLQGNLAQAIEDIKRAEALNPRSISEQVADETFSSPFPEFNSFVKYHPTNARAYQVRGIFRLFQKKENEAQMDFSKALELAPLLKSEVDWIYAELRVRR